MDDDILKRLTEDFSDTDFSPAEDSEVEGIPDSLTVTEIISTLTTDYGVSVPYEEINEENFGSVEGLAKMVKKLKKEG